MTNAPLLRRVLTTDSTNTTAFSRTADLSAEPTVGTGYIKRGDGPIPATPDLLMLIPVTRGNDGSTFSMRVSAAYLTDEGCVTHVPLYVFDCTASTAVGLSGKNISQLHRYCDTIAGTALYGTENTNYQIFQQTANQAGFVLCDMFGALYALIEFDITANATHMNALYGGF